MSALGDAFRAARESQGLSLSDVADRTHIRTFYLAAMEAEDWSAIGPPVYIRGFVRTYARTLGLDPNAAVAHLAATGSAGTPVLAPAPRPEPALPSRPRVRRRSSGLSYGAIAGVVVAFLLLVIVGYEYFDYQRARGAFSATTAQMPAGANRSVERRDAARPDISATRGDEHAAGFALHLRDSSWLRVSVDGKVMMEGVFAKGTSRSFGGRSATIRAGNAGAVDVTVDGKHLGPLGGLGDVAERSFQL